MKRTNVWLSLSVVCLLFLLGMALLAIPAHAQTFAYVTNQSDGTVSAIDTATNTVVANITVGVIPVGVAITPDGTQAYVANFGSHFVSDGTVSVIDTATNTVVATIPVGANPFGVAITPDGTRAYVVSEESGTVSVIDTSTNTVVATITVGVNPVGVAITPDGTRAYVTIYSSGTVSVIDTATNTVVATIPVGVNPWGVAITPGIGPPTNKDQCKNGGWETFTIPRKFQNQGDCVSFVNTGK